MFLTALNGPEDVARGIGASGNDYIIKPFMPDTIRERIGYWLRAGRPLEEDAV